MSEAPERIWIETRQIPDHLDLDDWATKPADKEIQHFTGYTRTDTIPDPAAIWQEAMEVAAELMAAHTSQDDPMVFEMVVADFEEREGRSNHSREYRAQLIRNIPNPYEATNERD